MNTDDLSIAELTVLLRENLGFGRHTTNMELRRLLEEIERLRGLVRVQRLALGKPDKDVDFRDYPVSADFVSAYPRSLVSQR
jgi:hypothetical protein